MSATIKRILWCILGACIFLASITIFSFFIHMIVHFLSLPTSLSMVIRSETEFNIDAYQISQDKYTFCDDSRQELEWSYSVPVDADGVLLMDKTIDFGFKIYTLNENYIIVGYSNDGSISRNELNENILNQLIYLNDNDLNAEVIYECTGSNMILYGSRELIIVYSAENNVYQYISVNDNSVMQELESNIIAGRKHYIVWVYDDRIEITSENGVIVDILPTQCQQ